MSQTATYRGKVRIGIDAGGKPIDKYIRARSKLELETAKQACREHYILGRPIPEDKMFYEYAEEWYSTLATPRKTAPTTKDIYTHLGEETMRRASVNLDGVFQKKAQKKAAKSGASARSRKPLIDNSLPWANKF